MLHLNSKTSNMHSKIDINISNISNLNLRFIYIYIYISCQIKFNSNFMWWIKNISISIYVYPLCNDINATLTGGNKKSSIHENE